MKDLTINKAVAFDLPPAFTGRHLIDGKWVEGTETFDRVSPSHDVVVSFNALGGEAETSLSSEYDGDGSGSGEIDRMSRARLLIGYDFGKANVFAAYGRAWAEGVLVPFGPESYDGKTWGVGGEYEISERFDVRLEGLADELENGSGYTYENRSVRAAAIVKF